MAKAITKNKINPIESWTQAQYLKLFSFLETEKKMFGKLPKPAPSTFPVYKRFVAQIDIRAVPFMNIAWITKVVEAYDHRLLSDSKDDWFDKYFVKKEPETPAAPPASSVTGTAMSPVDHVKLTDLIMERMDQPLFNMGQSIGRVLNTNHQGMMASNQGFNDKQRLLLDTKFSQLHTDIVSSLGAVVRDEVGNSVHAAMGELSLILVQSIVSQLPAHVGAIIRSVVNARIEEIFGPVEPSVPEPSPAEGDVIGILNIHSSVDRDPTSPSVAESSDAPVKDKAESSSGEAKKEQTPVATKRVRAPKANKDKPLGSVDRPLKILVLDLEKGQLSRARTGIHEKFAVLELANGLDVNDNTFGKYDYVIGSHYTSKNVGKSLAAAFPEKYILADGNFSVVRATVLRLVNEFRREVVVK